MMIEGVPLVDRAQAFDVHRAVHHVFMHAPLEQVGEHEGEWHGDPLEPTHEVNMLDVNVERGGAHGVNDQHMDITVVPAEDAGAIFPAKFDLPLADHLLLPRADRPILPAPQAYRVRDFGLVTNTIA